MVKVGRRFQFLLLMLMVLTDRVVGQDKPAPADTGNEGMAELPVDLEEVEDVLRTLDEAGVPPTQEEIARFLREQEAGRNDPHLGEARPFFTGLLHYRVGHYQEEGVDHYGKMSLAIPWLRLQGRVREYRTGQRERYGACELRLGPMELRAGALGLSHGHGLLVGAPGRGSTLAADSGFRPPTERMVTWLGSEDPRVVSGLGGSLRMGPWDFRFIREEPAEGVDGSGESRTVFQAGITQEHWRMGAACLFSSVSGSASISAGMRNGPLSGSLEVMALVPAQGIPPAGAAVLQMKWSPARGSGLEGVFGFSDLPAKPGMSSRPAVLPGWAGRGVALRGYTRTKSGLAVKAMVHVGRHLDRAGARSKNDKMLVDLQASRKIQGAVEISLRFRRDTRSQWEWSERYPWQAAELAATGRRTIVSGQVAFEENQRRARFMARSYGLDSESGHGRRSLIGLSGSQAFGRGWKIRATWVSAWGDPVDLVSAVSPVSGYVLPRHWGHWRSETLLGLEKGAGGLRLQTAISLRNPEVVIFSGGWTTIWATADIRW